jgi:hypothetical protein
MKWSLLKCTIVICMKLSLGTIWASLSVSVKGVCHGNVADSWKNDTAMEVAGFTAQVITLKNSGWNSTRYATLLDCQTAYLASKLAVLKEKADCHSGKKQRDGPTFLKYGDAVFIDMVPGKFKCVKNFSDYPSLSCFVFVIWNRLLLWRSTKQWTRSLVELEVSPSLPRKLRRPMNIITNTCHHSLCLG